MLDKKNVRYQIRILSIVVTAIVFLVFFWFYQYKSTVDIHQSILQTWSEVQYKMVEEVVDNAVASPLDSTEFDLNLMETVPSKLRYTDTSYGFIYKNGKVLFEQNLEITRQYSGAVIRDMYGAFSYQGGEHLLEVLEQMEQKKSGMDYFVKNHFKGAEYVTWVAFEHEGNSYHIGIATPETFILNEYDYYGIRNDAYVFSGIYTVLMVLLSSLLCFSLYRYKETVDELTTDMIKKNQYIQKEKKLISDLEAKLKQFVIKDTATGLYNRTFFDLLSDKLEDNIFLPVSLCVFSIREEDGSQEKDELLRLVAQTCQSVSANENNIIARYGKHEVALLMVNTSYDFAVETANQVMKIAESEASVGLYGGISCGIATRQTEFASTNQMFEEVENQLRANTRSSMMSMDRSFEGSTVGV